MQNFFDNQDIIVSPATDAKAVNAICIIRISGFESIGCFQSLLSIGLEKIQPRYQYFCRFLNPLSNEVLDEILFSFFKSPSSFTGENLVELSVHGNPLNIRRILDVLCNNLGGRLAGPGEFTLRALRNKKISLSQVEGLDQFLHGKSNLTLDAGLKALRGDLQEDYVNLRQKFIKFRSSLEINTDFSEDVGDKESDELLHEDFTQFKNQVDALNARILQRPDEMLRPRIVLFGGVNAGKSTLFNNLISEERSIVSNEKGTTRDYVSAGCFYQGVEFEIVDTAGLRNTNSSVESEGINRAKSIFSKAFFKILVMNPQDEEHYNNFKEELLTSDFDLLILTHMDQYKKGFDVAQLPEGLLNLSKTILLIDQVNSRYFGPIEPINSVTLETNKSGPIEPIGSVAMDTNKSGPIEPINSVAMDTNKSGPIEPINSVAMDTNKSGPIEPINSVAVETSKSGPIEPTISGPEELNESGPIEPFVKFDSSKMTNISSNNNRLACELYREVILNYAQQEYINRVKGSDICIPRQAQDLKILAGLCSEITELYLSGYRVDLGQVSEITNEIDEKIQDLIGVLAADDILNNIFANFCIGK